jgi:hypothetical protein
MISIFRLLLAFSAPRLGRRRKRSAAAMARGRGAAGRGVGSRLNDLIVNLEAGKMNTSGDWRRMAFLAESH